MRWISKLSIILISLALSLSLGLPLTASASSSVEDACRSLDRPNIDCVCVAKRIETYQKFSPTPEAKEMITQTYQRDLGLENDFEASAKAAFGDQGDMMKRVSIEMTLEPLGGTPSNIGDLETGCIIAGASPITIKAPRNIQGAGNFSATDHVAYCMKRVGSHETGRRSCQCTAERLTSRLTDREFEANFRSYGQVINASTRLDRSATTREDDLGVMARAMGISLEAFKGLLQSGAQKTGPHEARDTAYCGSRLWTDERAGQTAEERKLAGFEPNIMMMNEQAAPDVSDLTSGSKREQAAAILSKDCQGNGNSDPYCACYIRDFETRVVSASPDGDTTLAFALMTGGGAMPPMDYMSAVQSVPQSAHQSAAMILMSTPDLGENCTQGETSEPAPMKGTPAERMTAICVKDNEDQAMCQCMTGQLQDRLSPDDFELIVDIREADAQGAPDPLKKVAQDRGLSKAEAEEAMAMNQSMMGGIMGMDMMACMGGMGGMPGFPNGMPNISGMPGQ